MRFSGFQAYSDLPLTAPSQYINRTGCLVHISGSVEGFQFAANMRLSLNPMGHLSSSSLEVLPSICFSVSHYIYSKTWSSIHYHSKIMQGLFGGNMVNSLQLLEVRLDENRQGPCFATIAHWRWVSGQKRLIVHCTFGLSRYRKHTCGLMMVILTIPSNSKCFVQKTIHAVQYRRYTLSKHECIAYRAAF